MVVPPISMTHRGQQGCRAQIPRRSQRAGCSIDWSQGRTASAVLKMLPPAPMPPVTSTPPDAISVAECRENALVSVLATGAHELATGL